MSEAPQGDLQLAPARTARAGRTVAILDACMDFARLIELLVRESYPRIPVRSFIDLDEAERWIAKADGPVTVLADVESGGAPALERIAAWSSHAGLVTLIALANVDDGRTCAPGVTPKPERLDGWRVCFAEVLVP